MKKMLLVVLGILMTCLVGCGQSVTEENVLTLMSEKITAADTYRIDAVMTIKRGEKNILYDVNVCRSKELYKVSLTNRDNNNIQIIIKNNEGVNVLTPALNKSFQFQSSWPLNTYHAYLLESVMKEIANDENYVITKEGDDFIIDSKVDNQVNPRMAMQKVLVDRNTILPKEVITYNSNNEMEGKIIFTAYDFNPQFSDNDFDTEKVMDSAILLLGEGTVNALEPELLYPTIAFNGSISIQSDVTETSSIIVYCSDVTYTISQKVISTSEVMCINQIYDDFVILPAGVGAFTETSLTWYQNGIECAIYSEDLSREQMVSLAISME